MMLPVAACDVLRTWPAADVLDFQTRHTEVRTRLCKHELEEAELAKHLQKIPMPVRVAYGIPGGAKLQHFHYVCDQLDMLICESASFWATAHMLEEL